MLVTSGHVSEFINTNAWRYLGVLRILREKLTAFRFSEKGRNSIYSIYSRGERQPGGDELKEARKIKDKVNKRRTEGIPGRKTPDPNSPIQHVGDIIALTMVCVYPADIETAKSFIFGQEQQRFLKIYHHEPKEEGWYNAYHFVVGLTDPTYWGIRCEIQVKTILHDAWSTQTHDLTYKPKGALPADIKKHMDLIGKDLTSSDARSNIFRDQIHRLWELERKEKRPPGRVS